MAAFNLVFETFINYMLLIFNDLEVMPGVKLGIMLIADSLIVLVIKLLMDAEKPGEGEKKKK